MMPPAPAGGDAVMSTDAPQPRTAAGWVEWFEACEHNLDHWLARVAESPAESPPAREEPIALQMFHERLKRLQGYLDQAERDAAQALAPMTTEIQAQRQWLEALNMARAKLVERTARAAA
jgi:hypothetical protein